MRNKRNARGLMATSLAVMTFLVASCGSSGRTQSKQSQPSGSSSSSVGAGVTKDSITVSLSSPRSGPLGPVITATEKAGIDVWVNEVNSNGGINGRKVVVKKVDNQFTADGAIAACKEIQSNGSIMSMLLAGDATEATCLEKAGVPEMVTVASQVDPGWKTVHYVQSVATWGTNSANAVQNLLHRGNTKIGVIYLQDSPYGFTAKDGLLSRAKELGLDVVDIEAVKQSQGSFVAELQRLKAAGAQTIVSNVTSEIIGILRDAHALGYAPTWAGSGYITDAYSQAGRSLLDGVTGVSVYATTESPAYATYVAKVAKYGGSGASPSGPGMGSYAFAALLGEVLRAAGPNPTRASVLAGYDTIRGYNNQMIPPITWQPGSLAGATGTFPVVCCNPDFSWKGMGAAGLYG
jgi:branched-chain amino acid transport system substrate-binding protein